MKAKDKWKELEETYENAQAAIKSHGILSSGSKEEKQHTLKIAERELINYE